MLSYDRRGDAAWITIDRPEKRNAVHVEGWRELARLLERAESEARAAVVTGVDDAFCAGDDIAVIDDAETADEVEELADCLHGALFGVEALDVPVIAAVNGLAYGGGLELVLGCDLAVAVEGATFALPETRIGAYPPYAVERIAAVGGRKRLMELALAGEPIGAERALDWGLVNRVVPESELEPTVEAFVRRIAESPAASVAATKRYAARRASDAGARDRIVGALSQLRRDEACREATRAFLER
ncbi:enoyl-CoA hydratase/isomerase family protein [Halegenticoccus soli]|uniref:enoyl-CoA hydratase/isomerase family protein n=1 Tax=Halegenticoccus soli TaxID=1985678 RepID=UPI000C6E6867|nr:enoyl-CoA hydratase/isomerase family protein [Halegenticoccus soli]